LLRLERWDELNLHGGRIGVIGVLDQLYKRDNFVADQILANSLYEAGPRAERRCSCSQRGNVTPTIGSIHSRGGQAQPISQGCDIVVFIIPNAHPVDKVWT
jgi:hypothetical protein